MFSRSWVGFIPRAHSTEEETRKILHRLPAVPHTQEMPAVFSKIIILSTAP